jgi:hypothetical protein
MFGYTNLVFNYRKIFFNSQIWTWAEARTETIEKYSSMDALTIEEYFSIVEPYKNIFL